MPGPYGSCEFRSLASYPAPFRVLVVPVFRDPFRPFHWFGARGAFRAASRVSQPQIHTTVRHPVCHIGKPLNSHPKGATRALSAPVCQEQEGSDTLKRSPYRCASPWPFPTRNYPCVHRAHDCLCRTRIVRWFVTGVKRVPLWTDDFDIVSPAFPGFPASNAVVFPGKRHVLPCATTLRRLDLLKQVTGQPTLNLFRHAFHQRSLSLCPVRDVYL